MDTYFCYIHRDARPVAEMKILSASTGTGLRLELARLMADYPTARLELFQGDRLISAIDPRGDATPADNLKRATDALAPAG